MADAGFTLRTGPDEPAAAPSPAAAAAAVLVEPATPQREQELLDEIEKLRRENTELRRRAEVAEAIAQERSASIDGLRNAISTIKALPAGDTNRPRRGFASFLGR